MPDPSGTFHQVVPDDSIRRTYVVFSSVDIEPGKFMFWRVMNGLPGTKIFVNDEQNGWYVHGIPGLGDSVIAAVHALAELIRKTNPEEVVTTGPSMGGYGAMLYGALLKAELIGVPVTCLSFGGEFILYGRGTRSGTLSRKPKLQEFADIRGILKASGLKVMNVYGDGDVIDNGQADAARSVPGLTSLPIRNAPHAVSTHLGARGILKRLIQAHADDRRIPLSLTNTSSTPGFGGLLQKGHFATLDRQYDVAIGLLTKAVALCPESAVAHHNLGNALAHTGQIDAALSHQEHAADMAPLLGDAWFQRGVLLRKLGRNSEARLCYLKAATLMPHDLNANLSAAYYARNTADWDLAETFLMNVLALNSAHAEAREMLSTALTHTIKRRSELLERFR